MKYSSFDPTHFLRESVSVCGLQTSRPAEEGSEKHSGAYPPAECGFHSLYDGKADFYAFKHTPDYFVQKNQPRKAGFSLWFSADSFPLFKTCLTVKIPLVRTSAELDLPILLLKYERSVN